VALLRVALLRERDFARLTLAVGANSLGMVGEQVVLGWLVLELTDSPLMVGLAMGLRMAPLLLVGLPAGVLADRSDRLWLQRASGTGMAAAVGLVGALALFGTVSVWPVLVLTFVAGCLRAVNQVARQGHINDLVGAGALVAALGLIGVAQRVGGVVGSLLAGALTAHWGAGAAYLAVAAGYQASAAILRPAPASPAPVPAAAGSLGQDLIGYLGMLRRERLLAGLMVLTAGAEVLGFSYQALLPSLARDVLAVGAGGLGVMTAARSAGGIVGLALVPGLSQVRGAGTLFLVVLALYGASLVALGFASSFLWVLALLVLVDLVSSQSDVLSQSLVQLSVPRGLRGRAGGAWVVAIGTAPVGQLEIGALASLVGVGAAFSLNGLALAALAAAGALWLPRLRRL
jgi:hypothetical protein